MLKDGITLIIPDKSTAKNKLTIINDDRRTNGASTSNMRGKGDLTFTKNEIW